MGRTTTIVKGILLTLVCEGLEINHHACESVSDRSKHNMACEGDSSGLAKMPPVSKCGLYMAESAIPNSGLGMYTAVDIPSGHTISPEIVINLADYKEPEDIIDSYSWHHRNTRSTHEADSIESLVPGVGALANSHPGLVNTQMTLPKINSAGLHPYSDPGVGAFSNFHDLAYIASQHIQAGMEVFADYGE
eukprot:10948367-Ditylum_brightwellii.AAC.1